MSRLRVIARLVTGAASAVALSVVTSQVLTDGELHPSWLYLSVAVALMSGLYGEVFDPDAPLAPRQLPARGRRGVYLRQLRDSVRTMETVGVATQGEFVLGTKQIYVDVSLAPQPPHHTANEPYVGQAASSPGERRTLSSFLDGDNRVFAVIGGPGSGKTTLMRSTALALCHRGLRRRRLPVVLYLRDHAQAILADEPGTLAEVAALAGWVAGKTPASWIEHRLDSGGCLMMLDGLDEVADEEDRVRVVGWISRQIQRYPRNVYLVTSRPHGYLTNPLPNANVLQVRRFTGEQISRFLHGWYYAIECRALGTTGRQVRVQATAKANDLLSRLRSRPGLYDLAANPLLLTMIANVHRYRDALPGSRAALYGEMCQVLVHRRQEAKGLADRTGLRGPQKEHIMQGLALTMMCERIRDLPIAAACTAIAADLRGAATDVAPAAFLDEVRKSGLLVEREHGRYAFAHLTLQEYLAAAQIGDNNLDRLTGGVDDPWWRETTLLWAADADATPVVTACLKSGTVRALSLAFDCADEARTLDPAVRGELEKLLAGRPGDDLARQRLIIGVKAARGLREVIWLDEDTAVCAHPVSRDLYAAFVRDERVAGRHMPIGWTPDTASVADDAPAIGMWASDAARFVAWLNNLFDDGTRYRLPAAAELEDPAIDLVIDPSRHTIWIQSDTGPYLHRPSGAGWPYTPNLAVSDRIMRDLISALPYLKLAVRPPDITRVRAYIRLFTAARSRALESDNKPHIFVLYLALARDLARALALLLFSGDFCALNRALNRAYALARDLDRDLAHALERARDIASRLDPERPLTHDLDGTLAHALERALDHALALSRDLDHGSDLARARKLNPYLYLDRGRTHVDLGLDLNRGRALDDILDRDLDRALRLDHGPVRERDYVRALERGLDRAQYLEGIFEGARLHAVELDSFSAPRHALDRELESGNIDIVDGGHRIPLAVDEVDLASASALALDIVLDQQALMADLQQRQSVIEALHVLLSHWERSGGKPRPGRAFSTFAESLDYSIVVEEIPVRKIPAEALQEARDVVESGYCVDRDQIGRLLSHVGDLITPILERTAPVDEETFGYARIALLAAAALLRATQQYGTASLVIEVVRGLIAIQEREAGRLAPNEVMLLVRA
jgi:hypothetical protein